MGSTCRSDLNRPDPFYGETARVLKKQKNKRKIHQLCGVGRQLVVAMAPSNLCPAGALAFSSVTSDANADSTCAPQEHIKSCVTGLDHLNRSRVGPTKERGD